jgi:hypothetical protein
MWPVGTYKSENEIGTLKGRMEKITDTMLEGLFDLVSLDDLVRKGRNLGHC